VLMDLLDHVGPRSAPVIAIAARRGTGEK
jgi:hypothetical protein